MPSSPALTPARKGKPGNYKGTCNFSDDFKSITQNHLSQKKIRRSVVLIEANQVVDLNSPNIWYPKRNLLAKSR